MLTRSLTLNISIYTTSFQWMCQAFFPELIYNRRFMGSSAHCIVLLGMIYTDKDATAKVVFFNCVINIARCLHVRSLNKEIANLISVSMTYNYFRLFVDIIQHWIKSHLFLCDVNGSLRKRPYNTAFHPHPHSVHVLQKLLFSNP